MLNYASSTRVRVPYIFLLVFAASTLPICDSQSSAAGFLAIFIDSVAEKAEMLNRARSSRETVQDLELRLGPSYLFKGGMLASVYLRSCPEIILIEDDDDEDDVQIYPTAPPLEAFRLSSFSNSWENEIKEEDLELRLGVGGNSNRGASRSETKSKDPNAWKSGKASSSQYLYNFNEVKLRCSICMDTMKEETSTTCGHIFCNSCITNAIRVQRRCPTCRDKLSLSNIHRIYLPGGSF